MVIRPEHNSANWIWDSKLGVHFPRCNEEIWEGDGMMTVTGMHYCNAILVKDEEIEIGKCKDHAPMV